METTENNFIWIKGFKNLYKISPSGSIISFKQDKVNGKEIFARKNADNRLIITLIKDGVPHIKYLSRLVAHHFLPNTNKRNNKEVVLIDKNGGCNVENLKWSSGNKRMIDASKTKKEQLKQKGYISTHISEEVLISLAHFLYSKKRAGKYSEASKLFSLNRMTIYRLRHTPEFKKIMNQLVKSLKSTV